RRSSDLPSLLREVKLLSSNSPLKFLIFRLNRLSFISTFLPVPTFRLSISCFQVVPQGGLVSIKLNFKSGSKPYSLKVEPNLILSGSSFFSNISDLQVAYISPVFSCPYKWKVAVDLISPSGSVAKSLDCVNIAPEPAQGS